MSIDKKTPIIEQYRTLVKSVFPNLPPLEPKVGKQLYDKNTIMVCFGSNWENKRLSYDQLKSFSKRCKKLRSCPTGACIKELKTHQLLCALFSLSKHS